VRSCVDQVDVDDVISDVLYVTLLGLGEIGVYAADVYFTLVCFKALT
jgi:hypothetical protein